MAASRLNAYSVNSGEDKKINVSKGNSKTVIAEIKRKTKAFVSDSKNANYVLDLQLYLEDEKRPEVLLASIQALNKMFSHVLRNDSMVVSKSLEHLADIDFTPKEKVSAWLQTCFRESVQKVLELLHSNNSSVAELALCTLMKFVKLEGSHPLVVKPENFSTFPTVLMNKILKELLSTCDDMRKVISRFQEFLEYDDVKMHVLRLLNEKGYLSGSEKQNKSSDVYMNNVMSLLSLVVIIGNDSDLLEHCLAETSENVKAKMNVKECRRQFSHAWVEFLNFKMTTSLYKKILVIMHEKILPHLTQPLLLSDFLTRSYNVGGAISLLSLNSLFILINKHNLNYPDFYTKLYALFDATVCHVKYRARFFFLADLFLSSTHLPAYLVAAFIKRLARLSLVAPPTGILIIIPFIGNLLIRHPSCRVLLNKPGAQGVKSDPYMMEEPDPSKCLAINSSLWEMQTLKSHWYPQVASAAEDLLHKPLPQEEWNIANFIELTYSELFEKEVQTKLPKTVPMNHITQSGLFSEIDINVV